ncbi:hypothetical protein [Mucilaginibacter lacusdianchii]|uniref:hypothetical protein n=1 Tax=Mucilaginibacter lacusdianchii TaxID=2684211 RepID=UPI00131EA577|nr:hypothetical protein [Mucilaginibacter sp. JXJ CY 39]
MEIVLDQQQKPQGIFLPLSEWEQIKPSVSKASALYKLMDELTQKDIFEMDPDEFAVHLAPVAQEATQRAFVQGLYVSYRAGLHSPENYFVHEYQNGRKVLVSVDAETGKDHFVRNL